MTRDEACFSRKKVIVKSLHVQDAFKLCMFWFSIGHRSKGFYSIPHRGLQAVGLHVSFHQAYYVGTVSLIFEPAPHGKRWGATVGFHVGFVPESDVMGHPADSGRSLSCLAAMSGREGDFTGETPRGVFWKNWASCFF